MLYDTPSAEDLIQGLNHEFGFLTTCEIKPNGAGEILTFRWDNCRAQIWLDWPNLRLNVEKLHADHRWKLSHAFVGLDNYAADWVGIVHYKLFQMDRELRKEVQRLPDPFGAANAWVPITLCFDWLIKGEPYWVKDEIPLYDEARQYQWPWAWQTDQLVSKARIYRAGNSMRGSGSGG